MHEGLEFAATEIECLRMRNIIGIVLLCAAQWSAAAAMAPFNASFTVQRNGDSLGHMQMALTDAGNGQWDFVSRTEGDKGLAGFLGVTIEERSRLSRDANGFETVSYSYQQKMVARNRKRSLTRAADGAIAETDGSERWDYASANPVFDRHSVTLGIADRLSKGPDQGVIFGLPVAAKGKLETWRFLVVGPEEIETGNGRMSAIRVERMRENSDRKTVSWHAPEFSYLPIKVEQTEPDGEKLTSVLDSFKH